MFQSLSNSPPGNATNSAHSGRNSSPPHTSQDLPLFSRSFLGRGAVGFEGYRGFGLSSSSPCVDSAWHTCPPIPEKRALAAGRRPRHATGTEPSGPLGVWGPASYPQASGPAVLAGSRRLRGRWAPPPRGRGAAGPPQPPRLPPGASG